MRKFTWAYVTGVFAALAGLVIWIGDHQPDLSVIAAQTHRDTHGAVTAVRLSHRHGVTIVRLHTPKGPEIAYLIAGKYLAIGPLMDLKTGINVTPIWEKFYAK
ncbi:hypothetical protein [Acidithiobacillus ferriphilus]|uniref:hypothetical protein n=1 Tax=Acidithiobacillus ferriphilus TaxID=1689834 RepID=UPI001C071B30|nr:hypothetical protein [Acidithiobacillus ferriphilus]MBU2852918.1 hypothetical protein [Acidithiobacillus ferriphilus]